MNKIRGIFSKFSARSIEPAGYDGCTSDRCCPSESALPTFATPLPLLASAALIGAVALSSSAALAQDQKSRESLQTRQSLTVDSSLEKVVVTKEGDTFSSLAFQEFGSVAMARLLAEYNKLSIMSVFEAGLEIIIPTHIEPKSNFATVAFVKPGAVIQVAGSNRTIRELKAGDPIYTTDVVVTNDSGFISATLTNGSVINVQPKSRVSLRVLTCLPADPDCTFTLQSEKGAVSADVQTRDGQSNKFRIETPYASAAVRGTIFDFEASPSELLVGVTEGEVAVSSSAEEIRLPVGFGTRTDVDAGLGAPVQLLKRPEFLPTLQRLSEEDQVAWNAVTGAEGYLLTVSGDADGGQEIYRENLDSTVHRLRDLPTGEAFLSVRSLDPNRLRGFAGVQSLNIVDIDSQLPRPELEMDLGTEQVYVSLKGEVSPLDHELQFSTSADFSELVSVDIPPDGGAVQQLRPNTRFYVRARAIADSTTVGGYSEAIEIVN